MADIGELFTWNVDMEVSLFHAMRGHKPVGVNRHFQMVYIHNKLNESAHKKISSDQIWKQLSTLYQLHALNESEILPFPNKETDFVLPEEDYHDLKQKSEFLRMPRVDSSSSDNTDKDVKDKEIKTEKIDKFEGQNKSAKKDQSKTEVKGSPALHQIKKEGKSGSSTPQAKSGTSTPQCRSGSSTPQGKSDMKSHSTPQNKPDSKSHATPQTKDKLKEHLNSSLVDPSPKRKRTRQTNSVNASPATPNDTPPIKRRK